MDVVTIINQLVKDMKDYKDWGKMTQLRYNDFGRLETYDRPMTNFIQNWCRHYLLFEFSWDIGTLISKMESHRDIIPDDPDGTRYDNTPMNWFRRDVWNKFISYFITWYEKDRDRAIRIQTMKTLQDINRSLRELCRLAGRSEFLDTMTKITDDVKSS